MKKYMPLIFVELYLMATLVIFYFGPIHYNIRNGKLFLMLILLCHGFFIFGYVAACNLRTNRYNQPTKKEYSELTYWILFILGFVGVWNTYKNIMLSDTIIPYNFFDDLIRGFTEPGLAYADRMESIGDAQTSGSRFFNIIFIFYAFAKLLFVFYSLFFWNKLGSVNKLFFFLYSLIFISSGISAGLNSVIFLFFIFTTISIIVILIERRYRYLRWVLLLCVVLFLLPVTWFGSIMAERGGGFDYFASTSPLGDISVSSTFDLNDSSSFFDFLYYSFVWLCYYVAQGYYGFSLILNLDFEWTYGFGNSEFLQRQFLMITGLDISPFTFQSRIDHLWGKSAQWHSFYAQAANDVGLIGLPFLLCIVGFIFGKVWYTVIYHKNFFGLALIPIFSIMFIFFPANNQVFGFIDTFSYFIFVTIIWALSNKRLGV